MQSATFISSFWQMDFGRRVDRIRINQVTLQRLEGETIWLKRRTESSFWLVPVANLFFRLAGNPVRVFSTGPEWQAREIDLFRLLNGSERKAGTVSADTVYAEVLPGRDLVQWLDSGGLDGKVAALIGQAFRRMHGRRDLHSGELLSHGDPHLGNIIYDAETEIVGWIDFETKHRPSLSTVERQADDLLVFLQDLAGRSGAEEWKMISRKFLENYDCAEVLAALKGKLRVPFGTGAIWWAVRTSYLPRHELRRRIAWLRETL